MTPARHHQLTILGVFPFFEAYLRQDTDMRLFLEEMLPAENLDVTVQVQR